MTKEKDPAKLIAGPNDKLTEPTPESKYNSGCLDSQPELVAEIPTDSAEPPDAVAATTDKAVFRYIPNKTATDTAIGDPATFKPNVPAEFLNNKEAFDEWSKREDTRHMFYTLAEGVNPDKRINRKTNPVKRIHGLVGDYDFLTSPAQIDALLKKYKDDFLRPSYAHDTFSGGVRLVWLFNEPLTMDNEEIARAFIKVAEQKLKAGLFAGQDKSAWGVLSKMYDVGTNWRNVGGAPIPTTALYQMLFDASRKVRIRTEDPLISLDIVAAEFERRWPGKWPGDFAVGSRGPVAWEGRSNPTAAVVAETGMLAFSSHRQFQSWREIFGEAFMDKHVADKIGGAVMGTYFDGKTYCRKIGGAWERVAKEDFQKHLRVNHKLDSSKGKHETSSEVDRAEIFVQENCRVAGLIPAPYSQEDFVYIKGRKFLNSSTIKIMPYAETPQEYGENFPWLAEFLDTCWDNGPVHCAQGESHQPVSPRDVFFVWLRRFYTTALQGELERGQCLFLVGPPNAGKTLIGTLLLNEAMGGYADATDFLLNCSKFNKELGETPLWVIDDDEAKDDPQGFTTKIKKTVANPAVAFQPKYADQLTTEWAGRLLICLNDDEPSMRMVPDLVGGMKDKVVLLKFSDAPRKFPGTKYETKKIVRQELPFFLRWLSDWQPPDGIADSTRFGMRSFVHEGIRTAALYANGGGEILEIIDLWAKNTTIDNTAGTATVTFVGTEMTITQAYKEVPRSETEIWEGTVSEFLYQVGQDKEDLKLRLNRYTTIGWGRKFRAAARIPDSGVTEVPSSQRNGVRYRITRKIEAEKVRADKKAA